VFRESRAASTRVGKILELLPEQARIAEQLEQTHDLVLALHREMRDLSNRTGDLAADMQFQKEDTRSLDAAVWNLWQASLHGARDEPNSEPKREV
jgi:hypothetical protein